MTVYELHEILDDESRKITQSELKQIIYELKLDANNESYEQLNSNCISKYEFYVGEMNAFMICLDLLEHLDGTV